MEKAPDAAENAAMFSLIDGASVRVRTAARTSSGPVGQSASALVGEFLELISFNLNDGVTDEEWDAALEPSLRWTAEQPGYVSCDGFYDAATDQQVDVNLWESRKHSAVHMEKVIKDPVTAPMIVLVNDDTVEVHLAERVIGSADLEQAT